MGGPVRISQSQALYPLGPSPAAALTHLRPPPPLNRAGPRAWWALCQQARGRPLRPGSSQAVLGGSLPPLGVTRRPLLDPAGALQGQEEVLTVGNPRSYSCLLGVTCPRSGARRAEAWVLL